MSIHCKLWCPTDLTSVQQTPKTYLTYLPDLLYPLRGQSALCGIFAMLQVRHLLKTFCLLFFTPCIWVNSKRKAPKGNKLFSCMVDPFSERKKNNFDVVAAPLPRKCILSLNTHVQYYCSFQGGSSVAVLLCPRVSGFNSSDTETPFLYLNLCILNGTVSTKLYDKRDDFDFDTVNFPFLGSDAHRHTTYLNLLDSPELLQILVTLIALLKPWLPNFLGRVIVILTLQRRFRNFIAATVPW